MSVHIRFAEAGDRPQWQELWRGYQAFYEADLSAGEDALWKRFMAASGDGPYCLVAADGGKLLGLAHYLYHLSTWSEAPRCYLNDLFTTKEARGRGVGRALIEAVQARADAHGAAQVYWLTAQDNATARRLYDSVATLTPFVKYSRQASG